MRGISIGLAAVLCASSTNAETAGPFSSPRTISGPIEIVMPARLDPALQPGAEAFAQRCAACHGDGGRGSEQGPPLVHVIYEPGHHGDGSFYNAVLNGVRGHHWRYGDMAPIDGVAESEVAAIIAYIRALQRLNGVN